MEITSLTREGANIAFTFEELLVLTMLVQEGRLAFGCHDPVAETLDSGIRTAALRASHGAYDTNGNA
jgi:hypothetical protein